MVDVEQAAEGRRRTFQGHDYREKSEEYGEALCEYGAFQLFDALSDALREEKLTAAEMVKDAFWLADEAEKHQDVDTELEDKYYARAERLLKEAR